MPSEAPRAGSRARPSRPGEGRAARCGGQSPPARGRGWRRRAPRRPGACWRGCRGSSGALPPGGSPARRAQTRRSAGGPGGCARRSRARPPRRGPGSGAAPRRPRPAATSRRRSPPPRRSAPAGPWSQKASWARFRRDRRRPGHRRAARRDDPAGLRERRAAIHQSHSCRELVGPGARADGFWRTRSRASSAASAVVSVTCTVPPGPLTKRAGLPRFSARPRRREIRLPSRMAP